MTKKDYIRAANIVAGIGATQPQNTERYGTHARAASHAWTVREAFVTLFAGDNPRFDADRFREACGPVAASHKAGGK